MFFIRRTTVCSFLCFILFSTRVFWTRRHDYETGKNMLIEKRGSEENQRTTDIERWNIFYPRGAPRCTRVPDPRTQEFSVAVITPFRESHIVTIIISIGTTRQKRLSRDPAVRYFAGRLTGKWTLHGQAEGIHQKSLGALKEICRG